MRAAIRHAYGGPEVLRIEDIPAPQPGPDELRIAVRAVAVNRGDWELLTGRPRYIATLAGLFTRRRAGAPAGRGPKFKVLGYDIAGVVDAVGERVTRFAVGDAVFGECGSAGFGGFAEYVCVRESARVVAKPDELSFVEAAAIPEGGSIAIKALRDLAPLAPGMRVLINGAGGGAGTFALQLARAAGAEVTGVDSAAKADLMREHGADHVIDYRGADFARGDRRYDVILDLLATRPIRAVQRVLTPAGHYLLAGGDPGPAFTAMLLGPLLSRLGPGRVRFLMADDSVAGLEDLGRRCAAGELRPAIDDTLPLEQAAEALARIGAGDVRGKILLTV